MYRRHLGGCPESVSLSDSLERRYDVEATTGSKLAVQSEE